MWEKDNIRVRFRHIYVTNEDQTINHVMESLVNGEIKSLENEPLPTVTDRMILGVYVVTKAYLERRITEGEISGWVTLSTGRAFCQHRDHFNKCKGRSLAFARGIRNLRDDDLRPTFIALFAEHDRIKIQSSWRKRFGV